MRKVKAITTTQIRLFPPDVIPLSRIILSKRMQSLRSLFDFQGVEPIVLREGNVGIKFTNGSYGPKLVNIEQVAIEERKIVVKVEGESVEANAVYNRVKENLEEFNNNQPIIEIICTHETASSITLKPPFERVFSKSFLSFIGKSASKYTRNQWSKNYIMPSELKFSVRYQVTDDTLTKSFITLSPKELTIAPRSRSAPSDNLYWIVSPTDSVTHFKLIDDLERALSSNKASS